MNEDIETDELDREAIVIAHEAIINLLVNDWSAMSRSQLKKSERRLARALGREPEYPEPEPDTDGN